jgi:type I restriction enzyme S subunit
MNAERLLAHYERIADAPDAIADLRRFILDLAARGKLVSQDRQDEPASELLKRIAKEKARRAKLGEIRKPQTHAEIGAAEIPFALPPTWKWVRIGDVFEYDAGTKRDPMELLQDRWLLELEDIEKDTSSILVRLRVSERTSLSTKSEFEVGDILYGKLRPYLNKVVVADEAGYSTTEIVSIRPFLKLCPEYCALALRRPDFAAYVERLGRGTKMPRLRTPDAVVAVFPLPPLAEQHRIVAKVDQLMALCDRLETARAEREATRDRLAAASLARLNAPNPDTFQDDAHFALHALPAFTARPDQIKQLRQTILNLAVRGKLVPQDPKDEPASALLKRIATERARQAKEGKAKSQEPLADAVVDQAPFELPPNWTWGRFPELGKFGRGKSKHRPRNDPTLFNGGTHLLIQTGDVARSNGVVETYTNKYNDIGLSQSFKWPKGTLCITIAANIADSGILGFDACFPDSVVGFVPASMFEDARYFEYFVRTAKANLMEFAPATAQKNINLEILTSVFIPLPPLAEQRRIVAKVDALMALCDRLEASLADSDETRRCLLDALLAEALAPIVPTETVKVAAHA